MMFKARNNLLPNIPGEVPDEGDYNLWGDRNVVKTRSGSGYEANRGGTMWNVLQMETAARVLPQVLAVPAFFSYSSAFVHYFIAFMRSTISYFIAFTSGLVCV